MPKNTEEAKIITELFSKALNIKNLKIDDDFFNHGATSLTVVELQVKIEEQLDVKVPTSELMLNSSLGGWIKAYESAALQSA